MIPTLVLILGLASGHEQVNELRLAQNNDASIDLQRNRSDIIIDKPPREKQTAPAPAPAPAKSVPSKSNESDATPPPSPPSNPPPSSPPHS